MPYESMPLVLSADTVRDFILSRGGKVYNTELVKYFKPLLVHPETKGLSINIFLNQDSFLHVQLCRYTSTY